MDHTHEHDAGCGCGHHHGHHHGHHEGCGCGHHAIRPVGDVKVELDEAETEMLSLIGQFRYLPIARFALTSSADEEIWSSALAPVAINDPSDSMEVVKERGRVLRSLEDKGLITLDYDIAIDGYDYEGYRGSALYKYFEEVVAESRGKPGFQLDTAALDEGSMALTELGERVLGIEG